MNSEQLQTLSAIDRVVHEPARLMILTILYHLESADFIFILNQTSLTRGNLSTHLSKLESEGYIIIQKEFIDKMPRTLLRITPSGKNALLTYRDNMSQALKNLPNKSLKD